MPAPPSSACEGPAFVALNWLHQGVLLLDPAGRILFANSAAEEILASREGLRGADGSLQGEKSVGADQLRHLIRRSDDRERPGSRSHLVTFSCQEGRPSLTGLLIPLAHAADTDAAAILFLTDPDREYQIRQDGLQLQFGLTRTETAIAVAMLRGDGLAAAAKWLGVSTTTARTHLDNVFRKTGTRRQAELVRVVLQACSGIGTPDRTRVGCQS